MDLNKIASFYKDKRVLITGHTGFKGQWLAMALTRMGAKVFGASLGKSTYTDLFLPVGLPQSISTDIADYSAILQCIQEYQPEIVFHLAATTLVGEALENPLKAIKTNALGTANMLEACRQTGSVQAIINVTTDKVYTNESQKPLKEDDPLGGTDPYSVSKVAADNFARLYYVNYFTQLDVGVATVRAGNVIGGGDANTSRLVPHTISDFMDGTQTRMKNPNSIRPWQYVLEPLYGYMELASRLVEDPEKYSGAWNFGPNKTSFKMTHEIVEMMAKQWGRDDTWTLSSLRQYKEDKILLLDSTKAQERLGWRMVVPVEESVRRSVEWYLNLSQGKDMVAFSLSQLEEYEADIQQYMHT